MNSPSSKRVKKLATICDHNDSLDCLEGHHEGQRTRRVAGVELCFKLQLKFRDATFPHYIVEYFKDL